MEGELELPEEKIKRLQRGINDLVSVLALPAMWIGGEPSQIVRTLLDALLSMLDLDVVYARLNDPIGATPVEMVRAARSRKLTAQTREIGELVAHWLGTDLQKCPGRVRNPVGDGDISIVPLRLGLQGEIGFIVAGSRRPDFPRQTERLILNVAVNQAAIGLQEARLLGEQKRVANELDERVAQRTSELAAANEALTKEVAERRRAEEALWASERNLKLIIDTIPALAWSARPDGTADFFNQHYLDYVGLSSEQLWDCDWTAMIHPDDLDDLARAWETIRASGRAGEGEARLRRHDGEYRWFLFRTHPLRDENGNIVKWYGINTDIEARKQAEEQLRRSEAFLAEGQRLSQTGSFSWRLDTDEITFSGELCRIFGFEQDASVTIEQIGRRVHPEDIPLLSEKIGQIRAGGGYVDHEIRLRMPDDRVKYMRTFGHVVRHPDGRRECLGAVQEVTQRRLSEEALDKARSELAQVTRVMSLGTMTASIAHEVNQPLSGIITNASTCLRMLAADPPNIDGARETARRTIRDGNRAADVITRLRALFGKKDTAIEMMDLNDAAREVIALSWSELQRNRVVLRMELADDLPPVTGDRVQLQQVVLNLLRNASDAMRGVDDRPRQLVVKTERDERDHVRMTVTDVGVGFGTQGVEKIFEAFYTTKSGGMGIGLSISRSIIERHQGRLWARPNDGPGATFSFSIPRQSEGVTGAHDRGAIRAPAAAEAEQVMGNP